MTNTTFFFSVITLRRALTLAAVAGSLAASHAQAGESAQSTSAHAPSRAEVIADLNLWRRAGVDRHEELARYYQLDMPAYEQALAEYQRLRNGPAFAAEVARVLAGEEASVHATR